MTRLRMAATSSDDKVRSGAPPSAGTRRSCGLREAARRCSARTNSISTRSLAGRRGQLALDVAGRLAQVRRLPTDRTRWWGNVAAADSAVSRCPAAPSSPDRDPGPRRGLRFRATDAARTDARSLRRATHRSRRARDARTAARGAWRTSHSGIRHSARRFSSNSDALPSPSRAYIAATKCGISSGSSRFARGESPGRFQTVGTIGSAGCCRECSCGLPAAGSLAAASDPTRWDW